LLIQGHIRSFDTFFQLTHEKDDNVKKKEEIPAIKKSVPGYYVEKQLLPSDQRERDMFIAKLDDSSFTQGLFTIETLKVLEKLLTNAEDSLISGN
jgi:hypothetical protein